MQTNKKVLNWPSAGSLTSYQHHHRKVTPPVRGAFSGVFLAYCMAALVHRADDDACPFAKDAEGAVSAVRSAGWDPPTSGCYAPSSPTRSDEPGVLHPSYRPLFRHWDWDFYIKGPSLLGSHFFPVRISCIPFLFAFLLINLFTSCDKSPTPFPVPEPEGFVKMLIPADNPLTYEGVALGRALFFDPILSLDSSISCASCHQPALAFTDGGAVSRGLAGRMGQRSAPSLLNIGFHYKGVFWDGRSPSLEEQALHPLGDSLEMGNQWSAIQERLRQHPAYPIHFQEAFPNAPIGQETTAKALAQFQRTLISANSKFDQVLRGEAQFTPEEKRGWTIFFDAGYPETPMAECSHCHTDPLFTNLNFSNNGLDESSSLSEFPDRGLGQISGNKYDNGRFRVPTLRNILLTAPYMHDGRFSTIEEVIQHYNEGGKYAENVDPNVRPLHLSDKDQQDLITFLQTLTDSAALVNPSYYPAKN